MNLRPGRWRALHRIERDLAARDPCLQALFYSFTQQTRGEKMPRTERIKTKPRRLLTWLGRLLTWLGPLPDHHLAIKTGLPGPGWLL
jgi:hypothetical protein